MMTLKHVKVTNPRNVLVQIPGFVVSQWNLHTDSKLEVTYNEETGEVTVKPTVLGRGGVTEES